MWELQSSFFICDVVLHSKPGLLLQLTKTIKNFSVTLYFKVSLLHILHVVTIVITINYA